MAANHFSTANSELPEYIANNARNVLRVQLYNGSKGGDRIYNEDVSINTGHIPSWILLPFKDQNPVIYERKLLGIKYEGKGGAKYRGTW